MHFCILVKIYLKVISLVKILLLPFSLIYSLIMRMRNFCYDLGFFKSKSYPLPVIAIGNLKVGGTGKTPHTEFLINFFKNSHHPIAVLSRGYGRKTKGYRLADSSDDALSIGDEPFQIFRKFSDIMIAVDEKRNRGIRQLLKLPSPPKLILLDDAFQHRSVKPGLNILLTEYSNLYINDLPLPSGRLREGKYAAKRADIIVVTKSPVVLSPIEFRRIIDTLQPEKYQKVFFSYISYQQLQPLNQVAFEMQGDPSILESNGVLLVSAIANPQAIELYLSRYAKEVETVQFPDHHFFEEKDYLKINKQLETILSFKKIIVITEKDASKFDASKFPNTPLFYIPINIKFHSLADESFEKTIDDYVRSY